mgnify:CR=1 FL=1
MVNEKLNSENVDFDRAAKSYAEALSSGSQNQDSKKQARDDVKQNSEEFAHNQMRITFIDFSGKVLGDSEADYQAMENHLNRKEVREAIQGETGKDIRFSSTLKLDFLYIAVPVKEISVIVRLSLPLVQIRSIYNIILGYEFLGILAGITLTLIVTIKFSKSITEPVHELIVKSREISSGNYKVRVKVKSQDEIEQLAETFNNMASQLEKTVYDLKDKNLKMDTILNNMTDGIIAVDKNNSVVLVNSVACRLFGIPDANENEIIGKNILEIIRNTHINRMLNETLKGKTVLSDEINVSFSGGRIYRITTVPVQTSLKDSSFLKENPFSDNSFLAFNQGAVISVQDITNIKKLEQIRSEFVSNVTHELKTPLTSIRGFIETLRNGAIKDKEVADKFLEIIDIESERLYALINDILQLSEIESGKNETSTEAVDVAGVIEECAAMLKSEADKKNVSIHINSRGNNLFINASRNRIKQMLINLIDNGIKYNVSGGGILISVYKNAGWLIMKVKDTGIGIPEEHLPRIFERFYRVDKGRSRSMGGTGLGLSIVKHIVNLYNGDIKVQSRPGAGTEFIIRFPAL